MNTLNLIPRREFLGRTAGPLTLLSLAGRLATRGALAAPAADPPALKKLMDEMEAKGREFLSVPRKDGQFLNLLIKTSRARSVLEVGTSHGYSALWICLGLEETGGKLTTVEILPDRVALAKEHLARAGLSHRVTFHVGDAHQLVPTLDGPFDFVFLDADKEGQMDYFRKLYPGKLLPGAILAVHNAIRMKDAMKDFLDLMAQHPDFDSVVLSLTMDDGFSVSYRHRK